MAASVGIRREDKNMWERRVPLIPSDAAALVRDQGVAITVQTSANRVFLDDEFESAGCALDDDMPDTDVVLAVKEIPTALLRENRAYVYFSHTVKGQQRNMPMLRRLLDLRATLIDYEKITDDLGRRLIFFSVHAGYAGMIETLWCLAQRLHAQGVATPLDEIKHAYKYDDLVDAKAHLRQIALTISREGLGLPEPLVVGIAGYGHVAQGCREILGCLPHTEMTPTELRTAGEVAGPIVVVSYRESDMVVPAAGQAAFDLQEYYRHPERYRGTFADDLPRLDVLINATYWNGQYPRLVTREWVREHYGQGRRERVQVIGDISCDIEGGVELTVRPTMPDNPCYTWVAATDTLVDGVAGDGPSIMAVDNLPCELPRESSESFSHVLRGFVPALAACDFDRDFAHLDLPTPLKRAVICHRGELTPAFGYLEKHLADAGQGV